jgi:hypothetical protein
MNTQVKVTAKEGKVVIAGKVSEKDGKQYGYIRVESINTSMENGWLRKQRRSALIRGEVSELESLNLKEGQVLPGCIFVVESTTKKYENQEPKRIKKDGEILTQNGNPIYRDAFYSATQRADETIKHDLIGEVEEVGADAAAAAEGMAS